MNAKTIAQRILQPTPIYPLAQALYQSLVVAPRRRKLYRRFITNRSLCFDIGANRGDRSALFCDLGATVVAVEPVKHLSTELVRRFAANPRITVDSRAVGRAIGTSTIYVSTLDVISTMSEDWVNACDQQPRFASEKWTPQAVDVCTLDALIEQYGTPNFVKIDVEGFETEVLEGLTQPVGALSFEYTPFRPEPAAECLSILHGIGARRFNSSSGESFVLTHKRWLTFTEMLAFCCTQMPLEPQYGDIYARFE